MAVATGIRAGLPGRSSGGRAGWRPLLLALLGIAGCLPPATSLAGVWGRNYFPNYRLVNQDGEELRFYDDVIKGKVVSINFMFTSCADVCPVETAKLRQVQQMLGDRVGRDVFMYSITIDPEHDTPEVLKAYREQFNIGPGWQFLTGKREEIEDLQKRFGLYVRSRQEIDPLDHNVSLMLGNEATGRWLKRSPFDNPAVLANTLGYALHGNRRNPALASYDQAHRIESFDRGEYLFRTRCASCHTLGGGVAVGPDLLHVTALRDRDWLARWIREPDAMIAEGDPLAKRLVAAYKGLPMPNLSLNEVDVEALLKFLEQQHAASGKLRTAATEDQLRPPDPPGTQPDD